MLYDFEGDMTGGNEGGHFQQRWDLASVGVGIPEEDVIHARLGVIGRRKERVDGAVVEGRRDGGRHGAGGAIALLLPSSPVVAQRFRF